MDDFNRFIKKLKPIICFTASIVITFQVYCQRNIISLSKGFCNKDYKCSLPDSDRIHFNPYVGGHLCENFNPRQANFNRQYLKLQTLQFKNHIDRLQQYIKYDFSEVLKTGDKDQNGIIGLTYQRIRFHIENVKKIKEKPGIYLVKGKSKLGNVIRNFSGEINLLHFYLYPHVVDDAGKKGKYGDMFGKYHFVEENSKNGSLNYTGVFECDVIADMKRKMFFLDAGADGAVGYYNRTFVGIATDTKTGKSKKCIWGDERLPFSFDFDIGENGMRVNDKYKMNGWQTFYDESEYIEKANGQYELKNKWWLTKKR